MVRVWRNKDPGVIGITGLLELCPTVVFETAFNRGSRSSGLDYLVDCVYACPVEGKEVVHARNAIGGKRKSNDET